MTATTYHTLTDLSMRLLIGALVLGALVLMGVGYMQGHWPTGLSVDSRP